MCWRGRVRRRFGGVLEGVLHVRGCVSGCVRGCRIV